MTVPAVTDISARVADTYTASGYINAIRNHILNDTTHLTIDAYTADEGLTIGFSAGGEGQQVNLRKSGANTIAISIEPSGSITDPGDSGPTAPTGTSADWSGVLKEPNWDVSWGSPAAGSKVWMVELPDAFFVWTTDPGDDFQEHVLHAGRIYAPTNSADAPAAGQDGLGFLAGVPDNGNGSSLDWIGTAAPCSMAHWSTGEWSNSVEWSTPPAVTQTPLASKVAYRPLTVPAIVASEVNGTTSNDGIVGVPKYLRGTASSEDPKVLVPAVTGNQGWMHYNDAATASSEAAIWDKTVTP